MAASRPELFRGRHFWDDIIVLCVRWYLRYPLSYRDLVWAENLTLALRRPFRDERRLRNTPHGGLS